eukprot:8983578-Lingulodinium_polyedra.AAC.1
MDARDVDHFFLPPPPLTHPSVAVVSSLEPLAARLCIVHRMAPKIVSITRAPPAAWDIPTNCQEFSVGV